MITLGKAKKTLGSAPRFLILLSFVLLTKALFSIKNKPESEDYLAVDLGVSPGHILEELRMKIHN